MVPEQVWFDMFVERCADNLCPCERQGGVLLSCFRYPRNVELPQELFEGGQTVQLLERFFLLNLLGHLALLGRGGYL